MIVSNLEMQTHNLVTLYSRLNPFVTGCAAVVCILAATGLVTFLLAIWFGVDWAAAPAELSPRDLAWSGLRSKLDSPGVIIGLPTAITFLMLCFNNLFDARYTDLFAPPLAIAAGIQMDGAVAEPGWRRRWSSALVAYQGVYAASMLARYTNDSRKGMKRRPRQGLATERPDHRHAVCQRLAASYAGHGLRPGKVPGTPNGSSISDVYAGQYLTPSGTFSFLDAADELPRDPVLRRRALARAVPEGVRPGRDGIWSTCRRRRRGPRRSSCTTR